MRMSTMFSTTFKEAPREAEQINHQLLLRAGFIHQYGSGIFGLLPLGHRSIQKIISIVREEIDAIGCQEVSMTGAVSKEIWEETGRYSAIDKSMFRFEDRHGQRMVLNMTHEEPVVDLVRNIVNSYKQFPFSTYQFQTKFRDEARPRGGLIRLREFIMKDAYSFHLSEEDLKNTYNEFYNAYNKIFRRLGFRKFIDVKSDNGMFGGAYSHEFMLLTDSGEDTLFLCSGCDYKANKEVARSDFDIKESSTGKPMEKISTPSQKTIAELCDFLKIEAKDTCKAVLYETTDDATPVVCFIRGDMDVVEAKLESALLKGVSTASEGAIKKAGACAGSTGPVGLNFSESIVVMDPTVSMNADYVTGANEEDYHFIHFNPQRDFFSKLTKDEEKQVRVIDIAAVKEGDPCPECRKPLNAQRGIEIGNIFHLGDKYTKAMNFTYLDQNGKSQYPIMGCYGLGVTRALGSIVEEHHDDYGMILPITVAPFELHLMALNYKKDHVRAEVDALYNALLESGVDVLLDDRDKKPGFQFNDADLVGIPVRVVVSPKLLEEGAIEVSLRSSPKDKRKVPQSEAIGVIKDMIKSEYELCS